MYTYVQLNYQIDPPKCIKKFWKEPYVSGFLHPELNLQLALQMCAVSTCTKSQNDTIIEYAELEQTHH